MRYTPDLTAIRSSFDSVTPAEALPSIEHGDVEIIGDMARCWCIPYLDGSGDPYTQTPQPNERFIAWRTMFEPKMGKPYQRDFGDGYLALRVEFDLAIGEDVPAAMRAQGAKLPGVAWQYDMGSSGFPTDPAPNPYGLGAALLWHPKLSAGDTETSLWVYYYGVRDPRDGHPANIGQYGGSGNPGGPLPTSGKLKVGQRHRLGMTLVRNTLKDKTLILPAPFGNLPQDQPAIDAALTNANDDGYLAVDVDRVKVAEWSNVAFVAEDRARFQCWFANIYHGGHGPTAMPKARCHYDIGNIVVTDETDPPVKPQGDIMSDITIIVPTGTNVQVLNAIPVDNGPAVQAKFDAYVAAVRAKAQAAKDADAAKVDGQDVLDIVP